MYMYNIYYIYIYILYISSSVSFCFYGGMHVALKRQQPLIIRVQ